MTEKTVVNESKLTISYKTFSDGTFDVELIPENFNMFELSAIIEATADRIKHDVAMKLMQLEKQKADQNKRIITPNNDLKIVH